MHRPTSTRKLQSITLFTLLAICFALFSSCEKKPTAPDPTEITIAPENVVLFIGASQQLTAVGAIGAVSWASSNAQVATVVQQTGFVQAVGRGETTITATASGGSATRVVSVLAPPAIALSAATVEFTKPVGGADPAAQTVNVTNSGDGSITNLVVGTISYSQGQPTGWLTATLSGASTPGVVTLRVNGAGLARGTYTASVPIQAAGIANSPQNIAVTFRVQAPPSIALSKNTSALAGIPGETRNDAVNITNGGDLPLTGLSRTITYTTGQPQGWLQANLVATTAPTTLNLIATIGTLAAGSYSATVQVASSVAGVAPANIAVTLTVSPGPAIALSRTPVNASAAPGTNAAPDSIFITNGGGGTLSGLTLGTTTYGPGQTTGWLTAALSSTTANSTLRLTFASATLAPGTYTATVPVTSAVASNSPQNLTVNLTVGQPANLALLNPASVTFATWGNAAALPGSQAIQVTSTGSGSVSGLTVQIAYGSGSNWLSASFQGGTSTPTTLLLQPNSTTLPHGSYTATVTVSSTQPGITPRQATVTYHVQTFTVEIAPRLTASCSGCHAHFSGTPNQIYAAAAARAVAGNPNASPIICKPFNVSPSCNLTHGGGKFTDAALLGLLSSWIAFGAPFQ